MPRALEIPMESFARAVEIMLERSWEGDSTKQHPDAALRDAAVKDGRGRDGDCSPPPAH